MTMYFKSSESPGENFNGDFDLAGVRPYCFIVPVFCEIGPV